MAMHVFKGTINALVMWPQVVLQSWQMDVALNKTKTSGMRRHLQYQIHRCPGYSQANCNVRAKLLRTTDLKTPQGCFCNEANAPKTSDPRDCSSRESRSGAPVEVSDVIQ